MQLLEVVKIHYQCDISCEVSLAYFFVYITEVRILSSLKNKDDASILWNEIPISAQILDLSKLSVEEVANCSSKSVLPFFYPNAQLGIWLSTLETFLCLTGS